MDTGGCICKINTGMNLNLEFKTELHLSFRMDFLQLVQRDRLVNVKVDSM